MCPPSNEYCVSEPFALRTETELLLENRWVRSTGLQSLGFEFEFPQLRAVVEDIVGTRQPGRRGQRGR